MPLKLSLKPGERFVLNGAVVQNGDRRGVQPVVGVFEATLAAAFQPPHPAQGGVLEKARMQGAGRQFGDGGRAGDGDGVGAFGLHRRAGDGDKHEDLGAGGRGASAPS